MSKKETQSANKKVLFLCTGNSCRSQMAEAIINHRLGGKWTAVSAGTQPAGYVHPLAIRVLKEIGINHQGESKSVDNFRQDQFDLVVTVCDDARETCPVWLGEGRVRHVGFQDPARAQGTDEEIISVFREVRDQIHDQILELVTAHPQGEVKGE